MTLAGQWSKETINDVICYKATVKGVRFEIKAHDAALPAG